MKKPIRFSAVFLLLLLVTALITTSVSAITEAEIEAQVAAQGKDTVTGNVLIWFLCAVAFLKVSQKIDSFMASLGINVGHTGGSMLTDVLLATRGISAATGAAGHALGNFGRHSSGSISNPSTATAATGFFKGGLAGMVSRKVTNDAVKTATTTSVVSTAKATTSETAANTVTQRQSASQRQSVSQSESAVQSRRETQISIASDTKAADQTSVATHAENASRTQGGSHSSKISASKIVHTKAIATSQLTRRPSIGGALFAKSLVTGGSFANDVIGKVAQGNVRSTGMLTGDVASQALSSYMGIAAMGPQVKDIPSFSDVEIGGGRITGVETAPESTSGISFGMYHADQYVPPQGEYTTVHSADGAKWYKQYAQNAVERKPYAAPDGSVAYHERIIKKLPDPPKRKDRL